MILNNSLPRFPVKFVSPVCQCEYSEAAVWKLWPGGENVGQEQGQATVVVQPPNVDRALPFLGLRREKKTLERYWRKSTKSWAAANSPGTVWCQPQRSLRVVLRRPHDRLPPMLLRSLLWCRTSSRPRGQKSSRSLCCHHRRRKSGPRHRGHPCQIYLPMSIKADK